MHSMQTRGKVLILAKGFPPIDGGIETYSREISHAYRQLGYDVVVITACPDPRTEYEDEGVTIHNVGVGNQLIIFVKMLLLLLRNKQLHHRDIIHATTWRVLIPLFFIRLSTFSKRVVTVHGREVLYLSWYLKKLKVMALKSANIVVGVSRTALESAYKDRDIPQKAIVAFNGLNYGGVKLDDSSTKEIIRVFSFSRLVKRKNIEACIKAVNNIRGKANNEFEYVIAGSGPELPNLQCLATSLEVNDLITFLGRVDNADIEKLYKDCDIFLHPQIALDNNNDIEGFGLTIADAMSFGKAVIVGIDGGPKEFVIDNEFGYVVNGRSVSEIELALLDLINHPDKAHYLGTQGKIWVDTNLSWLKHVRIITSMDDVS